MKRFLLISICLLPFLATKLYGQTQVDTIQIKKSIFGKVYLQNGKALNPPQLERILIANPNSFQEMKFVKANKTCSIIFGGLGGFIIGYTWASSYRRGNIDWGFMALGATLSGISIPFSIAESKHLQSAVSNYNDSRRKYYYKSSINLNINENGLGLNLKF